MAHKKAVEIPKVQSRAAEFDRASINEEARTVEIAFSSETPVDRWYGQEILDHSSERSAVLNRIRRAGPLLMDHNRTDQVGVVEEVRIDADRRGRAKVRFGKSARAEEIFQDVKDGIRQNVSFTYRVLDMKLERSEKGKPDVYRVTRWEPIELSFVSVPADTAVGVGRSDSDNPETISVEIPMPENNETRSAPEGGAAPAGAPPVNVEAIRSQARTDEQNRMRQIQILGQRHHVEELAERAINEGTTLEQFRAQALEAIEKRADKPADPRAAEVGLTDQEARSFSFCRAIAALSNPTDSALQRAAAFEFEASRAAADKMGVQPKGLLVPIEVMRSGLVAQRDLEVQTATAGGNTVATNLLASSFIDLLRNRMVVAQRATRLAGLVGNIAIPRQTGGATAYWVGEGIAPTESQQAFDQVSLQPKTLGAFTDFTRKLVLQSSIDVEAFVRADLAKTLALAIDLACISGSGSSNQPRGILNTVGIGDVPGGTNGAAPSWANIVALETEVAADNADVGDLAYVTNALVRGKCKTTEKAAGHPVYLWNDDNRLNGYSALVSNQIPSNLDKGTAVGVCSAMIFGNWSDLIMGMWGALDLLVDPYTQGSSGNVRVRVLQDIDLQVRHVESFAATQDLLTA